MIDDPLGLAVQAILVLAAGMYPVGFLFGACSPCCPGCPPCGRCTHGANGCPGRPDNGDYVEELDFTFTVEGIGTVTIPDVPFEPCGTAGADLSIPLETLPSIPPNVPQTYVGAKFCGKEVLVVPVTDECGCSTCSYAITLLAEFNFDGDPQLNYELFFYGTLPNDCNETVVVLTPTPGSGWIVTFEDLLVDDEQAQAAFVQELADFLNEQVITMSLTAEPCECGACCENLGETCTDNVAERSCNGDWLGVDTTCENDGPCPTPPSGSCCDDQGGCTETIEVNCDVTWTEGGVCDPNPCPQPPEGACCDAEGGCTQTTEANCGGISWTEGVECDPNPCPQLGACCDDSGNCSQTFEGDCPGEIGYRWTEGVSCDPNPCGVVGWCCRWINGAFVGRVERTQAYCDDWDAAPGNFQSVWYEEETECPPDPP